MKIGHGNGFTMYTDLTPSRTTL